MQSFPPGLPRGGPEVSGCSTAGDKDRRMSGPASRQVARGDVTEPDRTPWLRLRARMRSLRRRRESLDATQHDDLGAYKLHLQVCPKCAFREPASRVWKT